MTAAKPVWVSASEGTAPAAVIEAPWPTCEPCAWSIRVDTTGPRLPNGQYPHSWRLKYVSARCGVHASGKPAP